MARRQAVALSTEGAASAIAKPRKALPVMNRPYSLQLLARRILLMTILFAASQGLFSTGQATRSSAPAAMFRNGLDHSGVYADSGGGVDGGVRHQVLTVGF